MPKRPKAKPVSTKSLEKTVSAAKQRRIDKQAAQEAANYNTVDKSFNPWNKAKHLRHASRIAQGKTYENWRRKNSARYDNSKPTASNLLTGHLENYNNRGSLVS